MAFSLEGSGSFEGILVFGKGAYEKLIHAEHNELSTNPRETAKMAAPIEKVSDYLGLLYCTFSETFNITENSKIKFKNLLILITYLSQYNVKLYNKPKKMFGHVTITRSCLLCCHES